MGLYKAIEHNKEHRKPYKGAKSFDRSCRNHGSCTYCECTRTFFDKKQRFNADEELEEFNYTSLDT
jgi:hypothetical protein